VLTRPDGEDVPFVAHAIPVSLLGGDEFDAVVLVVQERRETPRPPDGRARPTAGPAAAVRTTPKRRAPALADTAKPPA
jgi:hypothetical protein